MNIGWPEILILALLGLLLFGRRLPEVGRNLGKGIVEFKKGLSGIEDDVNKAADQGTRQIEPPRPAQSATPYAPTETQTPERRA